MLPATSNITVGLKPRSNSVWLNSFFLFQGEVSPSTADMTPRGEISRVSPSISLITLKFSQSSLLHGNVEPIAHTPSGRWQRQWLLKIKSKQKIFPAKTKTFTFILSLSRKRKLYCYLFQKYIYIKLNYSNHKNTHYLKHCIKLRGNLFNIAKSLSPTIDRLLNDV